MADKSSVGALRVSQLDANELDSEVVNLTKSQISQIFKYHKTTLLSRLDPEIQAGIKLLLWKFSLYDSGATVGQQILGIYYGSGSKGDNSAFTQKRRQNGEPLVGAAITPREKILYALLMIVCPWLKDRISTVLAYFGLSHLDLEIHWWLEQLTTVVKVAALFNVLIFLRKGVYLTLAERILGIRSLYPQRQGLRQVGFEFMTRELLWHGFSEFLFFLLPLINFQRIKNSVRRWLGPKVGSVDQGSDTGGHLSLRSRADLMSCAVCELWPVLPQEIGCRHVFCFYCISANMKADSNFSCPQCDHPVGQERNIKPLATHINPKFRGHDS